ncbi:MAG: hypothetical protein LBV74_13405 [Tannerella sp.]|jgi:Na+-transporting methylmalonyl-CoA/oxaloacetate decarboxylase gamma subunit|nr:hypothetical protein [Tannerella sp.]
MEDFGDWLYLLIIIIAGVSSLISSVRKKARQTAEQNQPRGTVSDNSHEEDPWNEESTPQQEFPERKSVTTIKPKQQPLPSYQSVTTQKRHYFDIQQEGQPSIIQENTEFMSVDADKEDASITFEDLPDNIDEWRKAFVYHEIIDRKY